MHAATYRWDEVAEVLKVCFFCRYDANSSNSLNFDASQIAKMDREPVRTCVYPVVLSTLIFTLTLHMQRIGEIHIAVIILNYVHTLLSTVTVAVICKLSLPMLI